jgi:tRNA-dihydrouridine synthase B
MSKNFWKELKSPIIALAPMVGITDAAYRRLAKSWGADVVYSEMIASEALIRGIPKAQKMMEQTSDEFPLVVQIMGNNPKVIAQAAKLAEQAGADGIDINFGCPAHKIARNYCGVMLMRDIALSKKIITAAIEAVDIPVSIKTRISIKAEDNMPPGRVKHVTILDFLKEMSDLPIAALMIHGRSFEDPFDGDINLEMIRQVKEIFKTGPVLANGGVTSIESSKDILEATGVDGLGLARSVLGKPWTFSQIKDYLRTGSYTEITWPEVKQAMLDHTNYFVELYDQDYFEPMRRHLAHYVKGRANASELRQALVQVNTPEEVRDILDKN